MTVSTGSSRQPLRWSTLHITLHWLIVVLILLQWLTSDAMDDLNDALEDGEQVGGTEALLGYGHAAIGILVLLSILTRLFDRFGHGRPPHPADTPNWAQWLARTTHFLLYTVLILMPAFGFAAFIGGIDPAEDAHELLWIPLLVLIAMHVAGALANHFYFRNGVLVRMLPGHGEQTDRKRPASGTGGRPID